MYFGDDKEKQFDEKTNAHFIFPDMYQRLVIAQKQRCIIDKKLGITYSEKKSHRIQESESSDGVSGNISSRDLEEMDEK